MSYSIGNTIADSLQLVLKYAEVLLKDVQPESFGRFATSDGKSVESNHPAFIYGHLTLYARTILKELGHSPESLPAAFEENFAKGCVCQDDVDGNLPEMKIITDHFFDSWNEAMKALREADDGTLQQPNPNENMAKRFPTLGSGHNFYAGGHNMMHMGQMSAWRRMMGLGPA